MLVRPTTPPPQRQSIATYALNMVGDGPPSSKTVLSNVSSPAAAALPENGRHAYGPAEKLNHVDPAPAECLDELRRFALAALQSELGVAGERLEARLRLWRPHGDRGERPVSPTLSALELAKSPRYDLAKMREAPSTSPYGHNLHRIGLTPPSAAAKARDAWSQPSEPAVPEGRQLSSFHSMPGRQTTDPRHSILSGAADLVSYPSDLVRVVASRVSTLQLQPSAAMREARATRRIGVPRDMLQQAASRSSREMLHKAASLTLAPDSGLEHATCFQSLHMLMSLLVCSLMFDYFSALLILLNGVFLGVQTHYSAVNVTEDMPPGFRELDVAFCIIFSVELAARLFVFGLRFFSMSTWRWNLLDFVLVTVQVVEEINMAVAKTVGVGSTLWALKFMRFLRLLRIMRMLRVVRFIGDLRTILMSVLSCFRPFVWTMMLLLLELYVFGVFFTQLVLNHRIENLGTEFSELEHYYGSLALSVLSLFQALTGGVDWQNLVNPLIRDLGWFHAILFCFFICFSVFALLNVLTGVFVENSVAKAKQDKDELVSYQAHKIFRHIDIDSTGTLTWNEFEKQLEHPFMQEYFESIQIDICEAYDLFKLLDTSGDGEIDVDEFLSGCSRLNAAPRNLDLLNHHRDTRRIMNQHMRCSDDLLHQVFDCIQEVANAQSKKT